MFRVPRRNHLCTGRLRLRTAAYRCTHHCRSVAEAERSPITAAHCGSHGRPDSPPNCHPHRIAFHSANAETQLRRLPMRYLLRPCGLCLRALRPQHLLHRRGLKDVHLLHGLSARYLLQRWRLLLLAQPHQGAELQPSNPSANGLPGRIAHTEPHCRKELPLRYSHRRRLLRPLCRGNVLADC